MAFQIQKSISLPVQAAFPLQSIFFPFFQAFYFQNHKQNKHYSFSQTVKPKEKYFNLKELQANVEGLIEMYPTYWQDNFIVCNEEGLLKDMEYNKLAKLILGVDLVGPVLVVPRPLLEED